MKSTLIAQVAWNLYGTMRSIQIHGKCDIPGLYWTFLSSFHFSLTNFFLLWDFTFFLSDLPVPNVPIPPKPMTGLQPLARVQNLPFRWRFSATNPLINKFPLRDNPAACGHGLGKSTLLGPVPHQTALVYKGWLFPGFHLHSSITTQFT